MYLILELILKITTVFVLCIIIDKIISILMKVIRDNFVNKSGNGELE